MGETARRGWSALVTGSALVAILALAPESAARAGCDGHGVSWDSDLRQTLDLLSASILGPAERSIPAKSSDDSAPCSGPSCSGRPGLPPASGMTRSIPPIEHWADAGAVSRPPADGSRPLVAPDRPARPVVSTHPPLRPPRA